MTFDEFVTHIKEYESDSFTAEGFNITHDEAVKVAEMCISEFVETRLDGCLLDQFLYEIRPEHSN